eukprot:1186207-Prorocentrum_minimum.AAC.2
MSASAHALMRLVYAARSRRCRRASSKEARAASTSPRAPAARHMAVKVNAVGLKPLDRIESTHPSAASQSPATNHKRGENIPVVGSDHRRGERIYP